VAVFYALFAGGNSALDRSTQLLWRLAVWTKAISGLARLTLHGGVDRLTAASKKRWSVDFLSDQLVDGRRFRIPVVVAW
jgi:hypothetical protein